MAANMMNSDENWRTPLFRQNMVTKMLAEFPKFCPQIIVAFSEEYEEAILHCGAPTNKNAVEMESQVFSKAKSKDEYLGFVARLIIHIKEMGPKPKIPGGPGGMTNQQPPQATVGGQMSGGQQNLGIMGPMASINQMGMMNQQGMVQIQQGMVQPGMAQQSGTMMGNMSQQQQAQQIQQQQIQQQQIQQQQQMQQQQMQQQQQIQQQQQLQQQQIQHQQQQQQQNPQQSQMMGQGFMGQQPMQNPQMNQNVSMQGQQISNPQVQMQIQTPQIQGMLTNQQPQQILQGRGMVNPNQMPPNRIMGQQQTMASQLTQMAAQQQQRKHRAALGSNAMGIPRPEHGPSYSMNRFQYYPSNISQQVENVNMVGQYQGPGPQQMQQRVNQFIPPNTSQGMSMAAAPSPTSMPVPVQVGPSPSYGNSPGSSTIMHSPAGPGMNVNNLRPYPNQILGVPSPNPTLNTPMSMAATPSPRNADDQACFEKIKELKKYTDLLQRMIAKIGNEDVEKSSKMKKLLEILTSPNQRVSMEILLKCEAALKKMERQQHDAGGLLGPAPPPTPSKDTTSPFQQIQDAIMSTLKGGSSNHTLLRTFRHTIGTFGAPLNSCESPIDDMDSSSDSESSSDIPLILAKELQYLDKRYEFKLERSKGTVVPLTLYITLKDPRLPKVPPLKVVVSGKYPAERPTILNFYNEYVSTPFFRDVATALKSRLSCVDTKPTLTEIVDCWEMSVRQTVATLHKKHHNRIKVKKTIGALGCPI